MSRTTIDYGIDLGTTNSSVAVLVGTTTEVVAKQPEGTIITPSAIWFDKRGKQYVGQAAKAQYIDDEENCAVEFKLRMGEQWQKVFQRSGRRMSPEEMSAEVVKSLKTDVHVSRAEDLMAAVITVPAAFELPQCEATRRAANLAGLSLSPLLQEPVAAALAYGFQSASNKVFWLVYDFGGGTFDVAVIQVRDGTIQVVNHAGDNYLGGKNIDWDIVENLLIPRLISEYRLIDFRRSNPRWRSAIAKLKWRAEEAKILVSRTGRPFEIWIEDLCKDDDGRTFDFSYELTPQEIQRIIEPWVVQSVNLCKKALQEKGLSGRDMEKTILVGGSSLFPWLQERVAGELGTKLDLSIDPMTVVARGAAVFAGTQKVVTDETPVAAGTYTIQLEYEPVGSETESMVGGRVTPPSSGSLVGVSVDILELRSQWRSGAIRLSADGTFMTEIHAEKGRKCEYQIVLTGPRGTHLSCSPDRFSYTVGMVISGPILTHNVGIAMANNKPLWFFRKGERLPNRKTIVCTTVVALRKGAPSGPDNIICIPVIEGTNGTRADRNVRIGVTEILPTNSCVKRDVPLGSDVEVTIEMDASRITKTTAFVPMLDEQFVGVFHPQTVVRSPTELQGELDKELERLRGLQRKAQQVGDGRANEALGRLETEQVVEVAKRQVAAAQGDRDAGVEGDRKLLALKASVDSVEAALEWPSLVREARRQIKAAHEVIDPHGEEDEQERLAALEGEVERAIADERIETLRLTIDELHSLGSSVAFRQPDVLTWYLKCLQEQRNRMPDKATADRLFTQAQRAIGNNDIEALNAAVRQLINLLPPDEQEAAVARGGFGGTVISQ